ncbi:hypothetical protein SLEP1_g18375 [Rubroshorea leprosula]|uniref:Uncharacterized protein n=1 Tax=Rubroshorea leprosula TaxID=152421 RepID=A0AAV5J659_9ROSI|nr:hypothetical protein SLEP1_g18375 [Rubroshorea leprosula]
MLNEKRALWRRVLVELFGVRRVEDRLEEWFRSRDSIWWKDLWSLDLGGRFREGWLRKGLVKNVGEGNVTQFWTEKWLGENSIKERVPRLFYLASKKECLVSDSGSLGMAVELEK